MKKNLFIMMIIVACSTLTMAGNVNHELMYAVKKGQLQKVSSLLSQGASVNATKDNDWTVLMESIYRGHIDKGADINAPCRRQWYNNCNMSDGFVFRGQKYLYTGWNPLLEAVDQGRYAVVEYLIDRGAKVNVALQIDKQIILNNEVIQSETITGWTPLMLAVENCQPRIVQLLISKKAKVKSQASDNTTALQLAEKIYQKNMIKMLKDKGA